jgi:acyl carrier protein
MSTGAITKRTRREVTDSDTLHSVFRSELMLPPDVDLATIAYGRTESWDSVAHMQLILALEEAFGIALDGDDVVAMSTYGEVFRILRDRHGLALDH